LDACKPVIRDAKTDLGDIKKSITGSL